MVRHFRAYKEDDGKRGFSVSFLQLQCCTFVISIILAHNADVSLRVHVFLSYRFWRHLIAQCLTGEFQSLHLRNMLPTLRGWPFQPKSSPLNVVFILQDLGIAVRLTHRDAC